MDEFVYRGGPRDGEVFRPEPGFFPGYLMLHETPAYQYSEVTQMDAEGRVIVQYLELGPNLPGPLASDEFVQAHAVVCVLTNQPMGGPTILVTDEEGKEVVGIAVSGFTDGEPLTKWDVTLALVPVALASRGLELASDWERGVDGFGENAYRAQVRPLTAK